MLRRNEQKAVVAEVLFAFGIKAPEAIADAILARLELLKGDEFRKGYEATISQSKG